MFAWLHSEALYTNTQSLNQSQNWNVSIFGNPIWLNKPNFLWLWQKKYRITMESQILSIKHNDKIHSSSRNTFALEFRMRKHWKFCVCWWQSVELDATLIYAIWIRWKEFIWTKYIISECRATGTMPSTTHCVK